jgi:DNA-binding MarR family transcriptional regulator
MDRTTLSRDLKPLAAAGWIELASSEDDARAKLVRVKPAGRRVLERAQPLWRKAQDEIDARLGAAGVNALHTHLDRAMARMELE